MAIPAYPSVPNLPGVPAIQRQPGASYVAAGALLLSDLFATPPVPRWGIIDAKYNFQIDADSFVSMTFDHDMQVSDFPVEQGSFESYNKVHKPYSGTVSLAKGGNESDRTHFLIQLKNALASLMSLYILVPEGTAGPVTLTSYSYERAAHKGATLLIAHIRFEQIRISPPVAYGAPTTTVPASAKTLTTSTGLPDPTAVQNPTAAAGVSLGRVAPYNPSAGLSSAFTATPPT